MTERSTTPMDYTSMSGRQLTILHRGCHADILINADKITAMSALADTLAPADPQRRELLSQAEALLAEAKTAQDRAREIFAEIARRTGMTYRSDQEPQAADLAKDDDFDWVREAEMNTDA